MGSRAFCPAGLSPARGYGADGHGCVWLVAVRGSAGPQNGEGVLQHRTHHHTQSYCRRSGRSTEGGLQEGGGVEIASQGLALPLGKAALQLRPSLQWGHLQQPLPTLPVSQWGRG